MSDEHRERLTPEQVLSKYRNQYEKPKVGWKENRFLQDHPMKELYEALEDQLDESERLRDLEMSALAAFAYCGCDKCQHNFRAEIDKAFNIQEDAKRPRTNPVFDGTGDLSDPQMGELHP